MEKKKEKDSKETGWIELKNKGHTLDGKTTPKNSHNPRIFVSLFSPRGLRQFFSTLSSLDKLKNKGHTLDGKTTQKKF